MGAPRRERAAYVLPDGGLATRQNKGLGGGGGIEMIGWDDEMNCIPREIEREREATWE